MVKEASRRVLSINRLAKFMTLSICTFTTMDILLASVEKFDSKREILFSINSVLRGRTQTLRSRVMVKCSELLVF